MSCEISILPVRFFPPYRWISNPGTRSPRHSVVLVPAQPLKWTLVFLGTKCFVMNIVWIILYYWGYMQLTVKIRSTQPSFNWSMGCAWQISAALLLCGFIVLQSLLRWNCMTAWLSGIIAFSFCLFSLRPVSNASGTLKFPLLIV